MITITEEMLKQLTILYNENEEEYDHWVDKAIKETDPAKRERYDKYAFWRHCKSTAMDKVFKVLGLEADLNDNYKFVITEAK